MSGGSWPDGQAEPVAPPWPPGYGWSPGQPVPPPVAPWWGPPYNGARYGLPPVGPGSLANPWARLGARLLDALFLLPVAFVCQVPIFIYFFASINQFQSSDQSSNNATLPISFILGLYGVFSFLPIPGVRFSSGLGGSRDPDLGTYPG